MAITASAYVTSVSSERSATRTERADDRAQEFAGMFAGVVHTPREKPEPKKPEGTSELDRPEKPEDDRDAKDVKGRTDDKTVKKGTDDKSVKDDTDDKTVKDADDKPVKDADDKTVKDADDKTVKDADDKTVENDQKPKRKQMRTVAATSGEVVQATGVLDPDLQAKLARVMQRMHDEAGKDVTVSETFRSQDRQNALYAQGRETVGQVVTWTRSSKHTQGRAVDLVVDGASGGFDDAYVTLQRIANEEGLRTLGAKDPGHLELPGNGPNLSMKSVRAAVATTNPFDGLDMSGQIKPATGTTPVKPFTTNGLANEGTPMAAAAPVDVSAPGQMPISRLAQLAQVADVAVAERPAQVARVATVARVAGTAAPADTNAKGAINAAATAGVQSASVDNKSSSKRFGGDSSDQGQGKHNGAYTSALAAAVAMRDNGSSNAGVNGVTYGHAVSSAERAAEVIAALQDAPARPLSQLTMSIDAGNGLTDKVQLSMRGSALNATIDASDAHRATVMNSRSDELVRALTRDGIDVESLKVRAAAGATVTATATPSQSSNDSQSGSRSEQKNPWQQQDRQRSQDDRRQQQREQRRGQAE